MQFVVFRRALGLFGEAADVPEDGAGAQFVEQDADLGKRVDHRAASGVLAQHQAVLAPHLARVETLVIGAMLDQAVYVNAGLVGEDRAADDALIGGHRTPRRQRDQPRYFRKTLRIDAGFQAIKMVQRHYGFFQRRVAGALAQAVDGGVSVGRTGLDRRQSIGGGQPQIVMGVHFDFEIADAAQTAHLFKSGERIKHAQRIGETKAPRPGFLRRLDNAHQEFHIGTRCVLPTDADFHAHIPRGGHEAAYGV